MKFDALGFPKFKDVVKNVELSEYPLGDPRRLDLLIKYMGKMQKEYLKSLTWWRKIKYRIRRRKWR